MVFTGERINKKTWTEIVNHIQAKTGKMRDKDFKEWLGTRKNLKYCVDPITYRYAYNVFKELKDDNDHLTVVVGPEGVGKSTFSLIYSALVSYESFGIKYVCYKPIHLYKSMKYAKPGDTILIDEGALFLFSREALSGDNKKIVKLLTICRQKNFHIIVCIPNFWILDTYLRDHRVKTLIHVFERGSFTAYKGDAIRRISKDGARYKKITRQIFVRGKDKWTGHFIKDKPELNDLTEKNYLEFKKEVMDEYLEELKNLEEADSDNKEEQKKSKYIRINKAVEESGITSSKLRRMIQKGTLAGKKIGGTHYVEREALENM